MRAEGTKRAQAQHLSQREFVRQAVQESARQLAPKAKAAGFRTDEDCICGDLVKLVLDPNVLIAAVLVPGLCRELVTKKLPAHERAYSSALRKEFAEKLLNKFGEKPTDHAFYRAYRDRVVVLEPLPLPQPIWRDSDDDLVIATARAGEAQVIITGDKDLLVFKTSSSRKNSITR